MNERLIVILVTDRESGEEITRMTIEEALVAFAADESLSMENGQTLADFKTFLEELRGDVA